MALVECHSGVWVFDFHVTNTHSMKFN